MRTLKEEPMRNSKAALYSARRVAVMVLICAFAAAGCSVREQVARSLGDALAEGGETYASDEDIELVGAATPFGLAIETLLAVVPDHRGLLLAAARGFTQYAYVFVQSPADELEERDVAAAYAQRERARRLYLRARDYGLRGLGFAAGAAGVLTEDPSLALSLATREDLPLMYWTALAWAGAISLGKDNPALVASLPAVDALVTRAAALDADFDDGALRLSDRL
jgi:hypothetical protein